MHEYVFLFSKLLYKTHDYYQPVSVSAFIFDGLQARVKIKNDSCACVICAFCEPPCVYMRVSERKEGK